uniref:Ig-like domain-containing protein n=1 Tax=Magallana gigas TaxID=29159 RepID=A0A8W8HUZ6_MAGGI
MSRWYGTLLLAVVFTAHSCDCNDSNRTEVLNIGDTLEPTEKTIFNICQNDNTGEETVVLPRTITSTNDGGLYRCMDIDDPNDPIKPTEYYVMVFIRHEVSSVIASDTDLGIEGQLIIHNISYECTSLLVCKVGNYINKEKESTVEKLIKVYVGRQPNVAITTLKDGKRQNRNTNLSICPRDGMVFSCNVMNTSPPPDVLTKKLPKWYNKNTSFLQTMLRRHAYNSAVLVSMLRLLKVEWSDKEWGIHIEPNGLNVCLFCWLTVFLISLLFPTLICYDKLENRNVHVQTRIPLNDPDLLNSRMEAMERELQTLKTKLHAQESETQDLKHQLECRTSELLEMKTSICQI